ncbi:glycosyltransferase family 4 protein [Gaiella sp.]|uniref:glycosyltransferase family 4 protein n=1 Tax=Gaiella sp. TaxID=2663207 RepID=UPI0032654CFE
MRLVFITQRVDPDDPILGATVAKITALAERFDEVVVVTDSAVPGTLPLNCRVRTFASRTRVGRGLRFTAAMIAEVIRRPRPVTVLAHMCPIYAVLAAPLVRPIGVRVVLWYAQWHPTRMLSIAARVSTTIVSVDTQSVPIRSAKVVGIGHGIDVAQFTCSRSPEIERPYALVALGRYSDSKGLDTIVRAIRLARDAGVDVRLECHGTSTMPGERAVLQGLERLVDELGLDGVVVLGGPIPRGEVPELFTRSWALVNNTRSGAPDKVVYEACASCLPILVSSPPVGALVADLEPDLRFAPDDPTALAAAIGDLSRVHGGARAELGGRLRQRVTEAHSTDSWADAIVRLST